MKIFALTLVLLQVADYCAANCLAPWKDVDGQCMACSSALGMGIMTYATAQVACESRDADLATIVNSMQNAEAFTCGTDPWIGYINSPNEHFQDGTSFVQVPGVIRGDSDDDNCYFLDSLTQWDAEDGCDAPSPFVCSKPYMTCPNLEDGGFEPIAYANPNNPPSVPPAGTQCVATTATYSCAAGFMVTGGNNPRTCQDDGTWSGSRPMCVHVGICSALTEPGYAGIMYSTNPHVNGMYIIGTAAVQMCDEHYEKESGTAIRVCMAGGMWSGTPIVCEKERNTLAIGLGVGLGCLLLIVIIICLVICCCCQRPAVLPAPRPYPRPYGPHPRPYPKRYH